MSLLRMESTWIIATVNSSCENGVNFYEIFFLCFTLSLNYNFDAQQHQCFNGFPISTGWKGWSWDHKFCDCWRENQYTMLFCFQIFFTIETRRFALFLRDFSPSENPEPVLKYSLFTQFRKHSGILPTIALLISLAAISRSSVVAGSL